FQQHSLKTKISLRIIRLEILREDPVNWNVGMNAAKYLSSFCSDVGKNNTDSNLWDHAILLTGHHINSNGNNTRDILGKLYFIKGTSIKDVTALVTCFMHVTLILPSVPIFL